MIRIMAFPAKLVHDDLVGREIADGGGESLAKFVHSEEKRGFGYLTLMESVFGISVWTDCQHDTHLRTGLLKQQDDFLQGSDTFAEREASLIEEPARLLMAIADQQLPFLQAVADIETTKLGLPDSLTVDVQNLKKTALACYHHKTHTIHFNSTYFNDTANLTALNAVLHECYHAQQYSMIDTYDTLTEEQKKLSAFKYLEQYKTELANYEDGEEDYSLYRNQQIESDAFAYAKQAMIPYKNHLAERRNDQ